MSFKFQVLSSGFHEMRSKFFLTSIILLLIIGLLVWGLPFKGLKNILYKTVAPISRLTHFLITWFRDIGRLIFFPSEFIEENKMLKKDRLKLLATEALLQETLKENKFLKQALKIQEEKKLSLKVSRVIGRNLIGGNVFFIIDQGSKQEIKEGQAVINEEGLLVGIIEQVFEDSSVIRLITSVDSQVNVRTDNFLGTLKGENGTRMRLDLVPADKIIKIGEVVLTTGTEGQFPPGLLAGFVEVVNFQKSEPLQEVFIKPALDFRDLTKVMIITD